MGTNGPCPEYISVLKFFSHKNQFPHLVLIVLRPDGICDVPYVTNVPYVTQNISLTKNLSMDLQLGGNIPGQA